MKVYLSENTDLRLIRYLKSVGYEVNKILETPSLGPGVGAHADLHMCRIGRSLVFADESDFIPHYPENAAFCAVCLDKYIIHRMDITSPKILQETDNLVHINVRQGYTKCSCVVIDGNSIITSDDGIYKVLSGYSDINVLKISGGGVLLPGFNTGFIGGASGRVGNEIIFNGDLEQHPDFEKIRDFILSRGLGLKYFTEYELTDIGSIIEF